MAYKLVDRVSVTVASAPGTGDITLSTAVAGFRTFSAAGASDGDTFPYLLLDGNNWEIGLGTYESSGPSLQRSTVSSSSAGGTAKISASASAILSVVIQSIDVALTLEGLEDTNVSSPGNGQVLAYEGGDWVNKTLQGSGIGGGLYGAQLSPIPTDANTSLGTWFNQSTATYTNTDAGICISDLSPPGGGNVVGLYRVAPSPPYTIRALVAQTTLGNSTCGIGVGWYDFLTGALHIISLLANGNIEVEKWAAHNSFAGNDVSGNPLTIGHMAWFQIVDDGTTVYFGTSLDGVNFFPVFSETKSSAYLGSSGYTEVVFFSQAQGQANLATLMSWDVS